jgi:hypothetical protein
VTIAEPTTLLTDWLVAACALAWGWRLLRRARRDGQRCVLWWAVTFAAIAAASVTGGAWHGFHRALAPAAADALWQATLAAAGVVGFGLLAASFHAHLRPRPRRVLLAVGTVKLALFLAWTATDDRFVWVILDYGTSMVAALALHALAWRRRQPGAGWVVAAVAVSFAGAGVQASGFALHPHFNHNDLYHVIQLGGLYLFQRGALLARDRAS